MFPHFDPTDRIARFKGQFRLGKVGLDAFQQKVVAQGFDLDGDQLSGAESLLEIRVNHLYGALCNSPKVQPPPGTRQIGRAHV